PAFIITLGGLLVFRGFHWLTIENQTVPVVEGGSENMYSLLTTYYLSPATGYVLAAVVVGLAVMIRWRRRTACRRAGIPVDHPELDTLTGSVSGQLLLWTVVVVNN